MSPLPPRPPYIVLFRSEGTSLRRRWYFHRIAGNYRITDPSQGYATRYSARRAIRQRFPDLPVIVRPPAH